MVTRGALTGSSTDCVERSVPCWKLLSARPLSACSVYIILYIQCSTVQYSVYIYIYIYIYVHIIIIIIIGQIVDFKSCLLVADLVVVAMVSPFWLVQRQNVILIKPSSLTWKVTG